MLKKKDKHNWWGATCNIQTGSDVPYL